MHHIEVNFLGNWNDGEEAAYRATLYESCTDEIGVRTQIFHAPWGAPLYVVGYYAACALSVTCEEEDIPVYRSNSRRRIYSQKWEERASDWEYEWYERYQNARRRKGYR